MTDQANDSANPRISVILPVYNGAEYIEESVASILNQTYQDFELIILDDGSTDQSLSLLKTFEDPRIQIVSHENMGLALTLNRGISIARGEFIARQDADDISLPERFEKQIAYLKAQPDCALLGTGSLIMSDREMTQRRHSHPCSNGQLQMRSLFDSFFVHSSVMIRRSALDNVGWYTTDPEKNPPEDFELWLRIANGYQIANLPEALVYYREVPGSISREKSDLIHFRAIQISIEHFGLMMNAPHSDRSLRDLIAVLRNRLGDMSANPRWAQMENWLEQAAGHLTAKWPQDTQEIGLAKKELLRVVRLGRFRKSLWGNFLITLKGMVLAHRGG